MLMFCPMCANIMGLISEGGFMFCCLTCPFKLDAYYTIIERDFPKLKEIDHIMGGSAAWKNVDSTTIECPECCYEKAYFMQMQTRSADEPMTTFYKCANPSCGYNWRD